MPRFVLLEHRWDGVHYDVMIEIGGALRTWAVDGPIAPGRDIPARALPDHRPIYLDYEGPISGDRGEVVRLDRGTYSMISASDSEVRLRVEGERVIGEFRFSRAEGDAWSFFFEPGPGKVV